MTRSRRRSRRPITSAAPSRTPRSRSAIRRGASFISGIHGASTTGTTTRSRGTTAADANRRGKRSRPMRTGAPSCTSRLPRTIADTEYTISANVTDSSRREVSGTGSVRVARQSYSVVAHPEHYLHAPGDKIIIDFKALDANDQPVQTSGTVKVIRQSWDEVWIDSTGHEIGGRQLATLRSSSVAFPPRTTPPWRPKFRRLSGGRDQELPAWPRTPTASRRSRSWRHATATTPRSGAASTGLPMVLTASCTRVTSSQRRRRSGSARDPSARSATTRPAWRSSSTRRASAAEAWRRS